MSEGLYPLMLRRYGLAEHQKAQARLPSLAVLLLVVAARLDNG